MSRLTKAQQAERTEALAMLRQWLPVGTQVHCILRHVSRSGMLRVIDLVVILPDGSTRHIGYLAALALGLPYDRQRDGIRVGGAGMDMGFHLVYSLSHALYPDGFGLRPEGGADMPKSGTYERPATKERAAAMVAQGVKFFGRNGDPSGWDTDGYALTHNWL